MSRKAGWLLACFSLVLLTAMTAALAGRGGRPIDPNKPAVPDAARKAIKDAYPSALVGAFKTLSEGGVTLYAVTVEDAPVLLVEVSADGVIAAVDLWAVDTKNVPAAVVTAVKGALDGGTIVRYKKGEQQAEVKDVDGAAKLVKLDKATAYFKAELKKGNQGGEVKVSAEGKVLRPVTWEARPTVTTNPPPKKK